MPEKIVSHVDAEGYFIGPVDAIASPLEPGKWQLPAGAVDVPPPVVPDGFRARLVGDSFQLEAVQVDSPDEVDAGPSPDQIKSAIVALTQLRLDAFAQTRGYDGVNSAAKYKDITDAEIAAMPVNEQPLVMQFRAECRYLAIITARTWARLYILLGEVQAGNRPVPTGFQDIEPELPTLEWPV